MIIQITAQIVILNKCKIMKLNYAIIFFLITQSSATIAMKNKFEKLFPEDKFVDFSEPQYIEINRNFRKHFGYNIPEIIIKKTTPRKVVYELVHRSYDTRGYSKNDPFRHNKKHFSFISPEIIDTFNPPPLTPTKKSTPRFSHKITHYPPKKYSNTPDKQYPAKISYRNK